MKIPEADADVVAVDVFDDRGRIVPLDLERDRRHALGGIVWSPASAMKRLAQPDDIAGTGAFLASDATRWITGDTFRVDGGSKL